MLDVKANFKIGKTDLRCRKCLVDEETQKHLLKCSKLRDNSIVSDSNIPDYEDLYSMDREKVEAIGRVLLHKYHCLVNCHGAQPGSHQASAATTSGNG